ncbi:hypothetical protein CNMCM8980_004041 [Aspergillus fumigatiaffinis]|nr:hypothetical protein CNMCM8980_004041 [Aspergillus fumigatiaffinis]
MVVINLDHIIPYHPSLFLKPPSKPSQPRASRSEVSGHSHFPLPPPSKSHPLPPRPPLPPPRHPFSQSASPALQNSSSSVLYRSSGPLKVINVPPDPASSTDIRHTTETNDFDKEFAKLDDATTFEGQPCLNPSVDNGKYQEDDGGGNVAKGQSVELSSENKTKEWIADRPQVAPAQAHLTHKVEGTTPSEPVNSELLATYTESVDAKSGNCVLDGSSSSNQNDDYGSAETCESLADNVLTNTAESEFVPYDDPTRPDSLCETTATPTTDSSQIGRPATVEEDSILGLAGHQQSLHNEQDTRPTDEDGTQTAVHPADDAESMIHASDAPQQPETCAVSESSSQNPLKSPSRSYSVSVVIPERPDIIATVEQAKPSPRMPSMGRRKRRSVSPSDIDSDYLGDNGYAYGNEDDDDSDTLPHPRKRRRRGGTMRQRRGQVRHNTRGTTQRKTIRFDEPRHHCQITGLQDIETIPVRGYLTRQVLLSRVVYSFTFEEDRTTDLLSNESTRSPSEDQDDSLQSGHKARSNRRPSGYATGRRVTVLSEEDKLLMKLKQKDHLPWSEIVKHFPGRTKGSLQVRYSTKLKGLTWLDESSEAANGLDSSSHESVSLARLGLYDIRLFTFRRETSDAIPPVEHLQTSLQHGPHGRASVPLPEIRPPVCEMCSQNVCVSGSGIMGHVKQGFTAAIPKRKAQIHAKV